ncbi:hypothetical protein Taro_016889 [Colocasia esculenta]|uniref:Uncharacterized protein n=1 Tax=Colocasia esculenta TaxID=4460 RepID=A0A843ULL8_COLES|nr:hypothetical protein [Colocasia esculenta]
MQTRQSFVSLPHSTPVLLVVSTLVFTRFRSPVLGCQSVVAPAGVVSRLGGVSRVRGGSNCGPSTSWRSEVAVLEIFRSVHGDANFGAVAGVREGLENGYLGLKWRFYLAWKLSEVQKKILVAQQDRFSSWFFFQLAQRLFLPEGAWKMPLIWRHAGDQISGPWC